jgi:hypothetical protein
MSIGSYLKDHGVSGADGCTGTGTDLVHFAWIISWTSRKLRQKRKYNQTQWEMISPGSGILGNSVRRKCPSVVCITGSLTLTVPGG